MARLRVPELVHHLGQDAVDIPLLGLSLVPLGLPVILDGRRDAIALVAVSDLVGLLQRGEGLIDGRELGIGIDCRVEDSGDIAGVAVDALHELQQADGLGHRPGQRVRDMLRNLGDLVAQFAVDVAGDQIIDMVGLDQLADRLRRQIDSGVNDELLGQLDDGPVGPADVATRATLRPQAGDDLDDEIDLVGQHGVQGDESIGSEGRELDVGGDLGVVGQPAAMVLKQLAEQLLGIGVLREHSLAGDLRNVGGLQVDLQFPREAVLKAGQLSPLVVEPGHDLGQLLLRRDDQPNLAAADSSQRLHDALQIEHLLHVAGDKLADFVDDENQ